MVKKLKILFIEEDFKVGGAEQQLFHLSKNLTNEFECEFLALNNKDRFGKYYEEEGFRVSELKLNKLKTVFGVFRAFFILRRKIKNSNPDIIHTQLWMGNFLGRLVGKSLGIPVISSERNIYSERNFFHKFSDKILVNYFSPYLIANSQGIINFTSKQEKISRKKFKLIYNGIDVNRFIGSYDIRNEFNISKNDVVLINIGSLTPQKNQKFLLESFSQLLETYGTNSLKSKIFLLIIGEGSLKNNLKQETERLGISNNVIFTGNRKDIGNLLYSSDIFVFPSLHEGLPNVVMEAMLSKKPVVAFDVVGCNELILQNKTGFLIRNNNIAQFNQAILKLIKKPSLRQELGDLGHKRIVQKFGVNIMVGKYIDLYKKILRKK